MTLIIDTASSALRLIGEDLHRWAATQTAFISSEMSQLADERTAVRDRLRELGMSVVMFEDLGGRDEDAVTAYLDGVARSDIYVGIVKDRYGRMLETGRSPTHDEYRFARAEGKRISTWVATDGTNRQGDARDFVQELETFHTVGRFDSPDDLATRVAERMAEIGAEDEAPWIKVGDAVLRASVIRDHGDRIEVEAEVRDRAVQRYLIDLRPDQYRGQEVQITTHDRSGKARIETVSTETRSASATVISLAATVDWGDGFQSMGGFSTGRYNSDDLVEVGLRVGLLGEPVPDDLSSFPLGSMHETPDPLAELQNQRLAEGALGPVARLLIVEELLGKHHASSVDEVRIGPIHRGRRRIKLTYTEARQASNQEPAQRQIEGVRSW